MTSGSSITIEVEYVQQIERNPEAPMKAFLYGVMFAAALLFCFLYWARHLP